MILLRHTPFLACALITLLAPCAAHAQGAGSAGATVLQLLAGGRAAALSGAYTAATDDADVLFYNPAGLAGMRTAAGLSYQRHVLDIGFATGAAAVRVGRLVIGVGGAFLDAGSIDEIVPDPDFGGQTGMETGRTVAASEFAGRASLGARFLEDRLAVGAGAGLTSASIAGITRSTPMFDLGAQWRMPQATVGATLRNLGPAMSGDTIAAADLPAELRAGAATSLRVSDMLGAFVVADVVHRLAERRTGFVAGIEAGLLPGLAAHGIGAVARIGYNGVEGDGALGALQLGAGLTLSDFAIDYAFQNYEFFGALHRFGVRWQRAAR